MTDPTLIVADEPTGDLDAKSAEEILDLLGELRTRPAQDDHPGHARPARRRRADRMLRLEKGSWWTGDRRTV